MVFDNADLALIEIDPNATERELRLVKEVRSLRRRLEIAKRINAGYSLPPDGLDALAFIK